MKLYSHSMIRHFTVLMNYYPSVQQNSSTEIAALIMSKSNARWKKTADVIILLKNCHWIQLYGRRKWTILNEDLQTPFQFFLQSSMNSSYLRKVDVS